jgi:hypothetical protein
MRQTMNAYRILVKNPLESRQVVRLDWRITFGQLAVIL